MDEVTLSRAEAVRIIRAGAQAARDGLVPACPYLLGGDAGQRVRGAAWIRGYRSVLR